MSKRDYIIHILGEGFLYCLGYFILTGFLDQFFGSMSYDYRIHNSTVPKGKDRPKFTMA